MMGKKYRDLQMKDPCFDCHYIKEQNRFDQNANKKHTHYHEYYEIFYFLGDEMMYFLEDSSIKLTKYDLILIPAYKYHKSFYKPENKQERVVLSFIPDNLSCIGDESLVRKCLEVFNYRHLQISDEGTRKKLSQIMISMADFFSQDNAIGYIRAKLMLCELLLFLVILMETHAFGIPGKKRSIKEKRIYDIIKYIHEKYHYPISLNELSEKFFVSKHHLCRQFKEVTGLGVKEFINAKRISEAELLLKQTEKSIAWISDTIGFGSQAFFIQLFKKAYGCTPRVYRRDNQSNF